MHQFIFEPLSLTLNITGCWTLCLIDKSEELFSKILHALAVLSPQVKTRLERNINVKYQYTARP